MNDDLISIIIPNYNGIRFLPFCLNSIKNQSYPNIEVLIVDNGSNDGSIEFIETKCPQIKIIKLDKNYGFAYAVNRGIEQSNGIYIALLNNDAVADKNWLIELVKPFKENKDVFITTSLMKLSKNKKTLIDGAGDIMSTYGYPYKRGYYEKDTGQYNKSEYIFSGCGGASMYKKELFHNIGLFDEDFFAYFEDVDLSFRAQLKGYKCFYACKSIVYHCHHGTSRRNPGKLIYLSSRNIGYLFLKNMPFILMLKYWHQHIFKLFIFLKNTIYDFKYGLFIVKGKIDILFNIKNILKKRQSILKDRIINNNDLDAIFWHGPESEEKINELTNFISLFILVIYCSLSVNILYLMGILIVYNLIKKIVNGIFNIIKRKLYYLTKDKINHTKRVVDILLGNTFLLLMLYYIFPFPVIIYIIISYIIFRELTRMTLRWSYSR